MSAKDVKPKVKQPRCYVCNKFMYNDSKKFYYHWIDFDNLESGEESYAHQNCWISLDFAERQRIVNSAASKGNLPMDSMYANMKDMYDKLHRMNAITERELNLAFSKISELEFISRWHKYPDEVPDTKYEDTFWVTTIDGTDIQRDCFIDGKWKENGINVIAWAFILIPSLFNDQCYPKKLNMYKYIDR